jgi:phosphatidylglycerol:prolipoprotein diacylglycerol transferase
LDFALAPLVVAARTSALRARRPLYNARVLPVLLQLGPFTLYTYSLLVNLGVAVGLVWLYLRAPADRRGRWLDIGIAAVVGGLIGARLLYVLVNGAYFATNPIEAVMIWRGGLAWPGAVAGALLAGWLWSRRTAEPLGPIVDTLSLPLALLSLLSWGGCLAAGCAYGVEVQPGQLPGWMVSTAPDLYGLIVPRWPAQLAGVVWSLVVLGLVVAQRDNGWPAGARGVYALSLTALGAFFISFVRGDPMPLLAGFRLDLAGNALVLVGTALMWALLVQRQPVQSAI